MRDGLVTKTQKPYGIDAARQKGEQKGPKFYPRWKTRQQEKPRCLIMVLRKCILCTGDFFWLFLFLLALFLAAFLVFFIGGLGFFLVDFFLWFFVFRFYDL